MATARDCDSGVGDSGSDVVRGGGGPLTEPSVCGLSDIASSSGYLSGVGGRLVRRAAPASLADSLFLDDAGSSSDDDDSEWDEDEWPAGHALPLPLWGCERPELCFNSLEEYQEFVECITDHLGDCISELPYDTISTFIQFCLAYEKQEKDRSERCSFEDYFKDYDLPILSGRNTCVGLSVDLLTRLSKLEEKYLGLKDCLYPVSCEEDLDSLENYCSGSTPHILTCEKEHVLVCARIRVAGRLGVVLMDPGYHTALPITVMEDGLYPHTGPYNTSSGVSSKTHSYDFYESNPAYVIWTVTKESRAGSSATVSVVHITKPFLSGMDISERRNLVYPMKTLINRDRKGNLISGMYFNLQSLDVAQATVFYNSVDGKQVRHKIPMSYFQEWRGNQRLHSNIEGSGVMSSLFRHNAERYLVPRNSWTSPKMVQNTAALEVSEEQCRAWEEAVDRVASDAGRIHEIYRVLHYLSYVLADPLLLQKINNINHAIDENSQYN